MPMRNFRYFFIFFFFICFLYTKAQTSHIDSLKQQLATAKADSIKIGLAYQISTAYSNTNLDSMVFYSKQTADLLKKALINEKIDSIKFQLLWQVSAVYGYVSNDSMVFYAQQTYLFSKENKSSLPADAEVNALRVLGSSSCR